MNNNLDNYANNTFDQDEIQNNTPKTLGFGQMIRSKVMETLNSNESNTSGRLFPAYTPILM